MSGGGGVGGGGGVLGLGVGRVGVGWPQKFFLLAHEPMGSFHGTIRLAHVNYFTTQIKEALIRLFFQDLTPGHKPR